MTLYITPGKLTIVTMGLGYWDTVNAVETRQRENLSQREV